MDAESLVIEQHPDPAPLKVPDGVEVDREVFSTVEPVLRELNLSQGQASKLISTYAEKIVPLVQERALKSFQSAGADLRAELAQELVNDPEVGGKNLNQARAHAAKAIAHFIPDRSEREGFAKYMNATGFGNQRHLVRIFAGAGRLLDSKPVTDADKFYGRK